MENYRPHFYEIYRRKAEDCDKDLNATLMFAGLFSAVTSAFIAAINSGFQPDSHEETAALPNVLIYKVQTTLFASLAVSLFSAFLAMLGKQGLPHSCCSRAVPSVAPGVTLFCVLFYIFTAVVGAVSVSCLYQTTDIHILRRVPDALHRIPETFRRISGIFRHISHILGLLHSAISVPIK
ncbi:hypothetical protein BDM02DRAFT_3185079 [Thelephora ganbajun]|uniref:Uncharacterized protein n=1 Tax=Thelephora ganbajun TaxID=370292 RepID=A0ACB6ZMG1_THEGA|nr:hypothetical protein BDM02DRAFT_3185079 [Thelephora ganbajun]